MTQAIRPDMNSMPQTRLPGEVIPVSFLETETVASTRFRAGGVEDKFMLVTQQDGHPVSYIARPRNENLIRSWSALQQAGLPVVPELYTTELDGEQFILQPDLKADGGELYGYNFHEQLLWMEIGYSRHRTPDPSIDQHFMRLTRPRNMAIIAEQATQYTEQATKNKIMLPDDDAFQLLVNKDGSWRLYILDVSHTVINSHYAQLDLCNRKATQKSIDHLYEIRDIFQQTTHNSQAVATSLGAIATN